MSGENQLIPEAKTISQLSSAHCLQTGNQPISRQYKQWLNNAVL